MAVITITITIPGDVDTDDERPVEELRDLFVGAVSAALPDGYEDSEVDWDIDE